MAQVKYEHGLNTRQFRLYEFLKSQGDHWKTQFEIVNKLSDYYQYIEDDFVTFHDCAARHTLTNDIRALNESDYITKPILSSSKGVKLANKQEFDDYIGKNIISTVNRLKRLKKMAKKGNTNGQCRLVINGKENPVFNAFIDSIEE